MVNKLKVCEMFQSISGESPDIGRNILFLRLSGCNLNCNFCDSSYHKKENKELSIDEIIDEYIKYKANGIAITGGEPFLQQDNLLNLINTLDVNYTAIETNGTITPKIEFKSYGLKLNVSPKLENSGNKLIDRFKPDVLNHLNTNYNCIFKFVVQNQFDLPEIKTLIEKCSIPKYKVYLMAEGKTKTEQEANQLNIIDMCLKEGFNFSPRLHILVWDSKRGV